MEGGRVINQLGQGNLLGRTLVIGDGTKEETNMMRKGWTKIKQIQEN